MCCRLRAALSTGPICRINNVYYVMWNNAERCRQKRNHLRCAQIIELITVFLILDVALLCGVLITCTDMYSACDLRITLKRIYIILYSMVHPTTTSLGFLLLYSNRPGTLRPARLPCRAPERAFARRSPPLTVGQASGRPSDTSPVCRPSAADSFIVDRRYRATRSTNLRNGGGARA